MNNLHEAPPIQDQWGERTDHFGDFPVDQVTAEAHHAQPEANQDTVIQPFAEDEHHAQIITHPPVELAAHEQAVDHRFSDSRIRNLGIRVMAKLRGSRTLYAPWEINDADGQPTGQRVDLITAKHYRELPDGTPLTSMSGKQLIKGRDSEQINLDEVHTKSRFMTVGLPSRTEPGSGPITYSGKKRTR